MLSMIYNLSNAAIILRAERIILGTLERDISNLREFQDIIHRLA